jgi:hypothetical protein
MDKAANPVTRAAEFRKKIRRGEGINVRDELQIGAGDADKKIADDTVQTVESVPT